MAQIFLRLYDYFQKKRRLCFGLLCSLILLSVAAALSLSYKEDIYDFLPFDDLRQKEMTVYQGVSQADRIVVIFELEDSTKVSPERLGEAVDLFADIVAETDTAHHFRDLTTSIEYDGVIELMDYVYQNIPFFMTADDYSRIDSVLTYDYVRTQLEQDKAMLMFPTGGLLSDNIQRDPLNLFTPTVARLGGAQMDMEFEMSDGYIFTPDYKRAFAIFTTPYGSSETALNAELVSFLDEIISRVESEIDDVKVHSIGAPVIAVGNASQIKKDSILAIAIAVTLILALLIYSFRSGRRLMFIAFSVGVGWCFALACMALVHDSVSIIVLGIASVVIGIAVNYPLHLFTHLNHEPRVRLTLKEVISPLLVGNVTTVGAFLCLAPLDAPAMRDLGLFGSFMLVGTILFVLVFLPHFIKDGRCVEHTVFTGISSFTPENKPWIVILLLIVTAVLGYYSMFTSFDADLSNINYMTDEQRDDLKAFQGLAASSDVTQLYVASEALTMDEAVMASEKAQPVLDSLIASGVAIEKKSATAFIPSMRERHRRLDMWTQLTTDKKELLTDYLYGEMEAAGFDTESFVEYNDILGNDYDSLDIDVVERLKMTVFPSYVFSDGRSVTVVDVLLVPTADKNRLIEEINRKLPDSHCFDVKGMNTALASSLSDNFDYICLSCGFIVFFFLWLSFGRVEISIMAFMPMAVSWIWILGLMHICGIQFNIVNVILATFIFGQGDDYTIFMTEGIIYEYAYKRKLLASYKNSIILSALIMFIGIGALIVAEHPALSSLAQVTIVGMFSVVVMAYVIPPLIFRWLVSKNGREREIPVTLGRCLVKGYLSLLVAFHVISGIMLGLVLYPIGGRLGWGCRILRGYACLMSRLCVKLIYGVKIDIKNRHGEEFKSPVKVMAAFHSLLDTMLLMSLSPNLALSRRYWRNPFFKLYSAMLDCGLCDNGEVLPIYILGSNLVMPSGNAFLTQGKIRIVIGSRGYYSEDYYQTNYAMERESYLSADCFEWVVRDKYTYKGADVERSVSRAMKKYGNFAEWVDVPCAVDAIVIVNGGYGAFGLMFALVHPEVNVCIYEGDEDKYLVASNLAALPANVNFVNSPIVPDEKLDGKLVYLFEPNECEVDSYREYAPVVIGRK